MANFNWNKEQREAIDFRGKNLLLSAAAGSGKTATLTQRIIELLEDPESNAEISRMLIVTFTNDAAAELKTRIAAALTEAIARDPSDKRLVRQLRDLEGAAISTTHSFLLSELKPYFVRFSLPPDFSVCEEAYVAEMKKEIMLDTVSDFFEGQVEVEDFHLLCDALSGARDDESLDGTLLSLWDDLMRLGLESEFLIKENSSEDFLLAGVGTSVAKRMRDMGAHYSLLFEQMADELSQYEPTEKNAPVAMETAEIARQLCSVSNLGYERSRSFLSNVILPKSASVKKEFSTEEYERFKEAKTRFKKELDDLYENYFSVSNQMLLETMEKNNRLSRAVGQVLSEFDRRFSEAKRERGKVDFNDIERFAAKLFCGENGEPTAEAMAVAKKYDHIFIDEYQDTNRLQDMIYTAISACGSRFMVGDVKQSVYRFRGACPEIFVKYRKEYEETENGTAIFMSENHRSDSGVIDFSNLVSDYIFPHSETPFEDADRLVCAKDKGEGGAKAEICIVEKTEGASESFEADYVASRIEEMLRRETLRNGEVLQPKHIAILLRTGKNASVYKKALENRGIPVKNSATESFFNYSEVLLLLSLLSAIDNPTRDVYLAATMKSPLFAFTMEELVKLRGRDKEPLWYSVKKYAENNSDDLSKRLTAFTEKLDYYREASRNMLCHKLLYMIITDSGFNALRDDSGNGRLRRSVRRMYSHSLACAAGGGGLHDFILYLKGLMSQTEAKEAASDANAVTIITVHRSKGLEYPVCFISDGAREFNMSDSKRSAIIDSDFGLFSKLPDPDGIVKCDNPFRRAAALRSKQKDIEEEMRVLYVALTRAREKIIVTMKSDDAEKTLEKSLNRVAVGATDHNVCSVNSWGTWVLDAASSNMGHHSFEMVTASVSSCEEKESEAQVALDNEKIRRFAQKLKDRLDFSYEKSYLSDIPSKLPVSKLSPTVLDTGYTDEKEAPPAPSFLSGEKKATAAEMGTATHLFLQFCNFDSLSCDIASEAERLCKMRFISNQAKELIRFDEIEKFAASALYQRIKNAREIYREVRFNSLVPALSFTENEEKRRLLSEDEVKICVQGVVDCLFTDKDGKTVLVDYKTDRLTKEELEHRALAEEKLISRHKNQLLTYKKLCADILGREIDQVLIYSLALGDTVELT
ncbi:MAG: UvrD-helicase domain-containing protein [Clostridia bacterium]|nr:UvrD-helicase domain-containing protein [Clostridia bacterium]